MVEALWEWRAFYTWNQPQAVNDNVLYGIDPAAEDSGNGTGWEEQMGVEWEI